MQHSEQLNELFKAHSLFLADVRNAYKGSQAHKYKYSALPDVLNLVNPLLAKHGLSVTQWLGRSHESVTVTTVLGHSSGQWINSAIEMAVEKNASMSTAQAVGSVCSYARRYSIMAALNISSSEDDNDAQVENGQPIEPPRKVYSKADMLREITTATDTSSVYEAFVAKTLRERNKSSLDQLDEVGLSWFLDRIPFSK